MQKAAIVTTAPEETHSAGMAFATLLRPGAVVALRGDLGAGKTTFVRGVIAGLGGDPRDVSSPTFALVNTYTIPGGVVHHVDAYRIKSEAELDEMGFDEYIDGSAIVMVEWPDVALTRLPATMLRVELQHGADDTRHITHDKFNG